MPERFDLAVIGGGPAGCAAAITASRRGRRVALLEAGSYPRHKVCGEFLSSESRGLLSSLLDTPALLDDAVHIVRSEIFAGRKKIEVAIAPAAASVSRYALDFALWNAALAEGVDARAGCGLCAVSPAEDGFAVRGHGIEIKARQVIECSGRHSSRGRRSLIGVKAHFRCSAAPDSVQLYFGASGYCGIQPVAADVVNVCALLPASAVAGRKTDLIRAALAVHPLLRANCWQQVSETVVTAAQFGKPQPLRDGVMRAGDAAGFIDPFLGDGISLALQSGALAGSIDDPQAYAAEYARRFHPVFRRAARLRRLLHAPALVQDMVMTLLSLPWVGNAVVAATRPVRNHPATSLR